ncbi:hypothetical protein EAI_15826 [Harpegnathos saltator]|uniref:Uncharacterized protein n=1 Tax=Harpegnathos saltator TaxID=610380 RepID=E2C1E0_HARSA|nr:hypothetical protein EAI_15826 [Harpegnathos saltator]
MPRVGHSTQSRRDRYFGHAQLDNSTYRSPLHLDADIERRMCNSSCPGLGNHHDKVAEDTDIKGEGESPGMRRSQNGDWYAAKTLPKESLTYFPILSQYFSIHAKIPENAQKISLINEEKRINCHGASKEYPRKIERPGPYKMCNKWFNGSL